MSHSSTPAPRHAHITGWGRYAPSQVLTNHDLERMVDTNDEWIVQRTGHPRAPRGRGPRDDRVDGGRRRRCGRSGRRASTPTTST